MIIKLFTMGIQVTLILLKPNGWFTIFGYLCLLFLLTLLSAINYKLLSSVLSGETNKLLSSIFYLFISPFVAVFGVAIIALLAAIFDGVIPIELILSNPSHESGFIALSVGVAVYMLSITIVPLVVIVRKISTEL